MLEIKSKRKGLLPALVLLLAPLVHGFALSAEASDTFAHPPELEPDVRFWIRVYTEVTTDQGLLHDDWNLGLVYEVLRFDPADSPRQRERIVAQAKAHYAELLRRFAALPGFGAAKARIMVGVVAKHLGVAPAGWESVAPDWPTLADVRTVAEREHYQAQKRAFKASLRAEAAAKGDAPEPVASRKAPKSGARGRR